MANHSKSKLPWSMDPRALAFAAERFASAAFGGLYVADFDPRKASFKEGELAYAFKWLGRDDANEGPNIWSEDGRSVEQRHSSRGLGKLCQDMLHHQLSACFGARSIDDDGVGRIELMTPGKLPLFYRRAHLGGRSDMFWGVFNGLKGLGGKKSEAGLWMADEADREEIQKRCPKLLEFKAPKDVSMEHQRYKLSAIPEPERSRMRAHLDKDTIDFRASLDWGAAIDRCFAEPLGKKLAGDLLLPAAAMGLEIPSRLIQESSIEGIGRAIAMAWMWNQMEAAESLERLAQERPDLSGQAGLGAEAIKAAQRLLRQAAPQDLDDEEGQQEFWREDALARHERRALSQEAKEKPIKTSRPRKGL